MCCRFFFEKFQSFCCNTEIKQYHNPVEKRCANDIVDLCWCTTSDKRKGRVKKLGVGLNIDIVCEKDYVLLAKSAVERKLNTIREPCA